MTGAVQIPRRSALRAALVLGSAAAVGVAATGCDSAPRGVVSSDGVLDRRFGLDDPRWRLAVPEGRAPRGLVVVLHGRGGDADAAFDLGYADAVAARRSSRSTAATATGTHGATAATAARWFARS